MEKDFFFHSIVGVNAMSILHLSTTSFLRWILQCQRQLHVYGERRRCLKGSNIPTS